MIPEQIMITLALADAGVTAIVGDRVFPGMAPEGAPLPAVVVKRIDAVQLHRPLRVTPGAFALCRARMRLGALYATVGGYVTGKELLQALRQACGNRRGTIAGFDGVSIGPAIASPEIPNATNGITIEPVDFLVTYREPV